MAGNHVKRVLLADSLYRPRPPLCVALAPVQ